MKAMTHNGQHRRRYTRHQMLPGFGESGQQRVERSTTLIVGLGGLGCAAMPLLAAAGVGRLLLNDFDRVDESNLARQTIYRPQDVGKLKAVLSADWIAHNNPAVITETLNTRLTQSQLVEVVGRTDVVLDCTDNIASRTAVAEACALQQKPLVFGAATGWQGQYAVFRFDRPRPASFSLLLNDQDEQFADCGGGGVFAPVLGVIGSAMAGETLKLLIGSGAPKTTLNLFDAQAGWRQLQIGPSP